MERDVFPPFVRSESYTFRVSVQAWERDSRISIQSKTSAGMWRRRPISRKASQPAFLEAWSLWRLVIEIYNAKQRALVTYNTDGEKRPRNTFQPSERWLELGGFGFHRCLRRSDSPVRALRRHRRLRPGHDTTTQARKKRESEGGSLKGHPKRRKPESKKSLLTAKEKEEGESHALLLVQSEV